MAYASTSYGVFPAASTANVLDSTSFDRLLLIHIATVTQNTVALWKNGSTVGGSSIGVALSTSLIIAANDVRDLGPYFFGSSESLVGGMVTSSSGWYSVERLYP